MPGFQTPTEENLREIMEILAGMGSDVGRRERRSSQRHSFPTIQLAAPYDLSQLPTKEQFREVPCHDISTGGLSFFLSEPPDFKQAVIGLGTPPNLTYMIVRVVYCSPYAGPVKGYLVGCEFLDRVVTPA